MAVPVNLLSDIAVESVIPFETIENPAVINAAAFVSVADGVNVVSETTKITESFVTPFKIVLFVPTLS